MVAEPIEQCEISFDKLKRDFHVMVIFGGAGDLSRRKLLPALYHVFKENELKSGICIIAFGLTERCDETYREFVKKSLEAFSKDSLDQKTWKKFAKCLFYVTGDIKEDDKYEILHQKIIDFLKKSPNKDSNGIIYYLAVPPEFSPEIVSKLKKHKLDRITTEGKIHTKIVVEKPFGRDRPSAEKLNRTITGVFKENQIYRIDHYLGKETVQNIIFFRFSNSIFEPLWNYRYIDNVQITVAEELGIENRGRFYEKAGVIRDIIQNHMMQLIALIAMEPPVGIDADYIRDEKIKIYNSIQKMDAAYIDKNVITGQYDSGNIAGKKAIAYRKEKDVAEDSDIPTYIAMKIQIDNWRWSGVPFYIRSGKRMPKKVTEICIHFKQPPLRMFKNVCDFFEQNLLIITIEPKEKIAIRFGVKVPHTYKHTYPVNMDFIYDNVFKDMIHSPYERLLLDCLDGDLTLFARQDGVEAMWDVVDPVIARIEKNPPKDFPNYEAGTWGPEGADLLLEKDNRSWYTE
jgi:glucose-6-phosphate 1-dehydrogenase